MNKTIMRVHAHTAHVIMINDLHVKIFCCMMNKFMQIHPLKELIIKINDEVRRERKVKKKMFKNQLKEFF